MVFPFWGVQALGLLAFSITAWGFHQTDDRRLKYTLAVGSFFWAAHYAGLGVFTAAGISVVIMLRQWVTGWQHGRGSARQNTALMLFFLLANTGPLFFLWQGPASLWPFMASTLATVALFRLKGATMRSAMMLTESTWVVTNTLAGSWPGLLGNAINLGLMWRARRKLTTAH